MWGKKRGEVRGREKYRSMVLLSYWLNVSGMRGVGGRGEVVREELSYEHTTEQVYCMTCVL